MFLNLMHPMSDRKIAPSRIVLPIFRTVASQQYARNSLVFPCHDGVRLSLIEVIESDFARLEAETSSAEATAQKSYDGFITDSKVDKAQKTTDSEHKTAKRQNQEQALTVKSGDLEGTQKELDAALAYYDKLKPSCVDSGVSYEDRVGRRKEEIESLQEALKILNGEDIA